MEARKGNSLRVSPAKQEGLELGATLKKRSRRETLNIGGGTTLPLPQASCGCAPQDASSFSGHMASLIKGGLGAVEYQPAASF